jgi:malate synthase
MKATTIHEAVSFPEKFWTNEYQELFPSELLTLLQELHQKFNPERQSLLAQRKERQKKYDAGVLPKFESKDSEAVKGNWKVSKIPNELQCRRVEITGPVNSAKMVIFLATCTLIRVYIQRIQFQVWFRESIGPS